MASTRVYFLAKELGVKSSAIIEKCQSEGLDIKTHMSPVSAGLAATIREWFSEGEHTTTLETAEKVDLTKVRVPTKRARKSPVEGVGRESEEGSEVSVMEEEPAGGGVALEESTVSVEESTEAGAVEEVEAEKLEEGGLSEKAAGVVEEQRGPVIIPEPVREKVMPAGPQLGKPAPAKLNGPQLVRVEEPEPDHSIARPRPKPKRRQQEPVTELLMGGAEAVLPEADAKKGGKRHKERTHGRRQEVVEAGIEEVKRAKINHQRRERDLEERRARLEAATGGTLRLKPLRKLEYKGQMGGQLSAPAAMKPEKAIVAEPITVKDLSAALAVKASDIISKLLSQGIMATANQVISVEVAELVALEFGIELIVQKKEILEDIIGVSSKLVSVRVLSAEV